MTFRIENLGVTLLPERRTGAGKKKGGVFLEHTSCSEPSEEGCLCCGHTGAEGTKSEATGGQDILALHAQLDEFLASTRA
jgi:hypothetical protein